MTMPTSLSLLVSEQRRDRGEEGSVTAFDEIVLVAPARARHARTDLQLTDHHVDIPSRR